MSVMKKKDKVMLSGIVKKEMFLLDAVDRKTGEPVQAMRSRLVVRSFRLNAEPEEMADLVMAKYWPDDFDAERKLVVDVDGIAAARYRACDVPCTGDLE